MIYVKKAHVAIDDMILAIVDNMLSLMTCRPVFLCLCLLFILSKYNSYWSLIG